MRIRLLGRFDVRIDGEPLPLLDSARAESLLAYVLLHPDAAQPRRHLAYLLWPDSTDGQARTNLRKVLHTLRHRLPDADRYLEITARSLRWRPESPYWLDVAEFERLLGADAGAGRRVALREAVDLYCGDLLEGSYDEWLLGERDRLRLRHVDALAELAELCEADGDVAEAITHAERLLRADPLREETTRQLMRLHVARGDRARALRAYHACSSVLERELEVEVSAATRAAYAALLPGEPDVVAAAPVRIGGPPLIGRAPERAQLVATWQSVDAGRAQFVLVSGEAGVGKSRLVEEFGAWCARRGAAIANARCYPAEGALAYGPVVEWLRSEAVGPRLARLDRARLTEVARLLPELLVEMPDLDPPEPLPDADLRHRLFDAVAAAVRTPGGPLLLVLDDLQHADRETCRLVHYLLRALPQERLLVVATVRREELDPDHPVHDLLAGVAARDRFGEIELGRLSHAETAALAGRLLGAPLVEHEARRLHDETEGNPLFVVEAIRAGRPAGHPLSPRVHAVIEARLAQLDAPTRDLVGAAATIGRAFRSDVLAAAADVDDDALMRGLDELWRRRIVREQSGGGDGYDFSHDKIREVAYLGVSPARRRLLHQRVAHALAERGADAGQVAAHHDRAGAAEQAITWYRRAAVAAQLLHANAEGVRLLERALALLASRPATPERDAEELDVRTALLAPLASVDGYASSRISAIQHRIRDLTRALGVDDAPPLLRSLTLSALAGSDFTAAMRFAEDLRAAGARDGDDVDVVEATYVRGVAAFWRADFDEARLQFELAVARYRPEDRHAHLLRFGQDPRVLGLARLGNTLWFLGEPVRARAARTAALAWAEERSTDRGVALVLGALLALDMGDEPELRRLVTALTAIDVEAPQVRLPAVALAGHVGALDGRAATGIAAIRGTIEEVRGAEALPGLQATLGRILLAACVAAGDAGAAVDAADRLLGLGGAACVWAPEARRVRAAFLAPQR